MDADETVFQYVLPLGYGSPVAEGDFLKVNSLENYTQIGFICNKEGKVLGVSTIGTTQSFFDQEFRYAKHEAGQ